MNQIKLSINGREVAGFAGQTILDIARANGIEIPTLCHDERVEMYGSCGLCVVEAAGNPRLLRACSTMAADGMSIQTDTPRLRENRKAALELLLSDHTGDCRPPCVLACPGQTDCQGYVGLIANGEYEQALKLVKDKIPLPASIGRVCPHPCEEACRRELVEEPVSIAALKQFVGDIDLAKGDLFAADVGAETGKSVAVIGGGPGGLTAAYFLRAFGHAVTVYDAMPRMGGMLRYGIPEYRLPKKLLQQEIDAIQKMGVGFRNNVKIGQDVKLEQLQKEYDAVIVAAGAWTSTGLGCPGEDLDGVVGGIDFLREVALSDNAAPSLAGKKIAIVGGGNTAMDACRTAVRLGASEVYNIYRRTKNEMPAEAIEIQEAEEEGVIFKNLTNPIEIIGGDGKVKAVRLQIMELGEPDASGRRSPVAVAGAEETIEADMVIVAIGQKLNAFGLEALEQTRRGTIAADEHTFRTNLPGVFAVGDATNKGADIAISAIGEARNAAGIVDRYLNGAELAYEPPYLVKSEKTAADFAGREKAARVKMPHRCAGERKSDFLEINLGWSAEQAKREAARCLECGCPDYFECKLIDYANQYRVRPEKYAGKTHHREPLDDHPFIRRNPDKCILCGLCVRVCGEVVGAAALGLVDRGFDTVVKPALDMDLRETDCIACGQCVNICPTGALTETLMIAKQVPLKETVTETVCSFCSVGCKTKLSSAGNLLTRSVPDDLLCMKGRFGFGEIAKKSRLTTPLINPRRAGNSPRRAGNNGEPAGFEQAAGYVNENFRELQARFGSDCVAVTISDRYTNQEVFLIREYAQKVLKTDTVFSLGQTIGGIADVLGRDASTATFDGLENAGLIVAIGSGIVQNHGVAAMKIRRAVNKGAKLLMISPEESLLDDISALRIDPGDELAVLEQILRLLLDNGCGKGFAGYDELSDSLVNTVPGEEAQSAANMIGSIQKPLFVFERNTVTLQAARLIADMAVLSGGGLIQLLPGANSQGLLDLGARSGEELRRAVENGKIRGLFIFGEDAADLDYGKLDFLAVQELHMTATAQRAQVVFPASSFVEKSGSGAAAGSYTAADGRVQQLKPAVAGPVALDNAAQIKLLMTGIDFAEPDDSGQDEKCGGSIRLAPAKPDTLLRGGVEDTNTLRKSLMAFTAEKV